MEPRIQISGEIRLVGTSVRMSLADNKTKYLWQRFMPEYVNIKDRAGRELYSVEVYDDLSFFRNFSLTTEFYKWAAVPVADFDSIPNGLKPLLIPAGLYAVFPYKGKSSEVRTAYQFIYNTWIPDSIYELDSRPHFAVMGQKYKNDNPDSEEELWIPITTSFS